MKTNFQAAQEYIKMKRRHNQESLCGPGSHKANTREAVHFINKVIKEYNIKNILDLGCGDWNWFNEIDLTDCNYIGWDCDHKMIQDNISRYAADNIYFEVNDIVTTDYPEVDLIICRDVLFHLEMELACKVLNKIKEKSKCLISTSFNNRMINDDIKSYCRIKNWGFYQINLDIAPFNMKQFRIDEIYEPNQGKTEKRYMCLYSYENN